MPKQTKTNRQRGQGKRFERKHDHARSSGNVKDDGDVKDNGDVDDRVIVDETPAVTACTVCGHRPHEIGVDRSTEIVAVRCACELEAFARMLDRDRWLDKQLALELSRVVNLDEMWMVLAVRCVTFDSFEATRMYSLIHSRITMALHGVMEAVCQEEVPSKALLESLWGMYRLRVRRGAIQKILAGRYRFSSMVIWQRAA